MANPNPPLILNPDTAPEGAVYLSKRGVSAMTSMSIPWINKLMATGQLRYFKVSSRRVLFLRSDIIELISKTEQAG